MRGPSCTSVIQLSWHTSAHRPQREHFSKSQVIMISLLWPAHPVEEQGRHLPGVKPGLSLRIALRGSAQVNGHQKQCHGSRFKWAEHPLLNARHQNLARKVLEHRLITLEDMGFEGL